MKPKRVRPKAGDVFQIALPTRQYAYLRLSQDLWAFCVYDFLSDEPAKPPIGLRKFRFTEAGMWEELRSGFCPKVGSDPFAKEEPERQPKLVFQRYPWTWAGYPLNEIGRGPLVRFFVGTDGFSVTDPGKPGPVPVEECIGLPVGSDGGYHFDSVVDRLLEGEDGPTAAGRLPLLCDSSGKLHYMPWSIWRLEWFEKMPRTSSEHQRLAAEAKVQAGEFEQRYWRSHPELQRTLHEFHSRFHKLLTQTHGRLLPCNSADWLNGMS